MRLAMPLHIGQCAACGGPSKSSCGSKFIFCSIKCRNIFTDRVEKMGAKEKRAVLRKMECEACSSGN